MQNIQNDIPCFTIRFATSDDSDLIVEYIRKLACFEGELDFVSVTGSNLKTYLFEKKGAEVIIGKYEDKPVGFALFHQTFSTFLGKPGIGLVDLYIETAMRNRGFGKAMLAFLAKLTIDRDCGRLEWWCHDWNEHAINLYRSWGALPLNNIRVYRLADTALASFAKEATD